MTISLDHYDFAILQALEKNGALTNAQLSEVVNLSPVQGPSVCVCESI